MTYSFFNGFICFLPCFLFFSNIVKINVPQVNVAIQRTKKKSGNLLDGADDDLAERVDEWLQNITGVQAAEDPTPQEKTVDKLPVVH